MNVIEIEGFILILIGALSIKGYTQIKSDFNYTMNKIKTKEGFEIQNWILISLL